MEEREQRKINPGDFIPRTSCSTGPASTVVDRGILAARHEALLGAAQMKLFYLWRRCFPTICTVPPKHWQKRRCLRNHTSHTGANSHSFYHFCAASLIYTYRWTIKNRRVRSLCLIPFFYYLHDFSRVQVIGPSYGLCLPDNAYSHVSVWACLIAWCKGVNFSLLRPCRCAQGRFLQPKCSQLEVNDH